MRCVCASARAETVLREFSRDAIHSVYILAYQHPTYVRYLARHRPATMAARSPIFSPRSTDTLPASIISRVNAVRAACVGVPALGRGLWVAANELMWMSSIPTVPRAYARGTHRYPAPACRPTTKAPTETGRAACELGTGVAIPQPTLHAHCGVENQGELPASSGQASPSLNQR